MSRPLDRLYHPSRRDLLVIGVPIALLTLAVFVLAWFYGAPSPPRRAVIASGTPEGSYQTFALRYQEVFKRERIDLAIRPTLGAKENLDLLLDPKSGIDFAFVQAGVTHGRDLDGLVAVGSVYPEPLWVFRRHADGPFDDLKSLQGKRIAVGPEGSGTRVLALQLLEAHGLDAAPTRILPLSGLAAAEALRTGEIDAAFLIGAAQSGAVWTLLFTPGIDLMDCRQAEAYGRRLPFLQVLTLPRGTIDLARNVPDRDIRLVGPTARLIARDGTHPALVDLMLEAASEVHGPPDIFQRSGQFPNAGVGRMPLAPEAERYYKSGKPFLQRYLPFWAATLVSRIVFLAVPVAAVLLPLLRVAPGLYGWRVRRRVVRYYGELKLLELDAQAQGESQPLEHWLSRLDHIESSVNRQRVPLGYADQLYMLRLHIEVVRERIRQRYGAVAVRSIPRSA
jgi:TRAP transporter TAXI family solute receptor